MNRRRSSSAALVVAPPPAAPPADAFALELAQLPPEARLELGELEARSVTYERAATALKTRELYRSRWSLFLRWCTPRRLSALPAHPDVVRLWLVSLEREGRSLSTLYVSLAAIRKAHSLAGHAPPESDRLRTALRGLRRTLGPKAKHADAIGVGELRALAAATAGVTPPWKGLADRAILLVLFLLGLRRSELCALELEDLTRGPEGYLVRIRSSKTDQSAEGQAIGLPVLEDVELCAVRALDAWLVERAAYTKRGKRPAGGPVFPSLVGGEKQRGPWRPLTGRDVARRIRFYAARAGFDPVRFRPHGFRAGLATESARRGASIKELQAHLRHRDLGTTLRYVREGEALGAGNPARTIGSAGGGAKKGAA
jgi:integrase